jgi:hypothetical protein
MLNSKILAFLFVVPYNNKIELVYNYEESTYNIKKNSGNDERFNTTIQDINIEKLRVINSNIIKKDLLELLNNSNTNIYNKLYIIEKYMLNHEKNSIRSYDLTAGNLFREFYDNNTETF